MENLAIKILIKKVDTLTAFKPVDEVCLDMYHEMKKQSNGESLEQVLELLRDYQTKTSEEDAIKFGLMYYIDLYNKEAVL